MTILRSDKEISAIRDSGQVIKNIFAFIGKEIIPGVSTAYLDGIIEKFIRDNDAIPAFKGYKGFPATICASVNNVVVHGIPSEKIILKDGDIISVDVGVKKNDLFTDATRTFGVGTLTESVQRLVDITRLSLDEGIKKAVQGNRVSDISIAIQEVASRNKLQEVRMFVGHGVGKQLHEAPEIPNWGEKGEGPVLKEGQVLAIEPMINMGTRKVKVLSDGWTAVTADNELSAHFEDTVIVGREKAEIVT